MIKTDSLIIGNGEVGSAIYKVLEENGKNVAMYDIKDPDFESEINNCETKTLHITYPYSDKFFHTTYFYIEKTKPELVIIHSTVPVGTTKELIGRNCFSSVIYFVHSPVRGQHPNLYESLKTFVKYIGTDSDIAFEMTKKELKGMPVRRMKSTETSELAKLLCTSYYGIMIAWHREMKDMCDYFNVDFYEAVTDLNRTYNEGYCKFRPNVVRPILDPPSGKIGGHCVVENSILLGKQYKSNFLDLIK
ncbi:hypothetical protein [Methanoculleus sp.]|uniref:hypothetical protein n=1 Tax=Methanoculleus sp. TaxID=90427 RepID=UPI0025CEC08C|nr:hypothetical protein [Methanoculleus sp.]MCK9319990.1 hypothetical protein [Methanoculleus sp.]